jgi:hypothetical protein
LWLLRRCSAAACSGLCPARTRPGAAGTRAGGSTGATTRSCSAGCSCTSTSTRTGPCATGTTCPGARRAACTISSTCTGSCRTASSRAACARSGPGTSTHTCRSGAAAAVAAVAATCDFKQNLTLLTIQARHHASEGTLLRRCETCGERLHLRPVRSRVRRGTISPGGPACRPAICFSLCLSRALFACRTTGGGLCCSRQCSNTSDQETCGKWCRDIPSIRFHVISPSFTNLMLAINSLEARHALQEALCAITHAVRMSEPDFRMLLPSN